MRPVEGASRGQGLLDSFLDAFTHLPGHQSELIDVTVVDPRVGVDLVEVSKDLIC